MSRYDAHLGLCMVGLKGGGGGGGESMIGLRSELFVVHGEAVLQPSWCSVWGGGGESMIGLRSELFMVHGQAVLQPSCCSAGNLYCKAVLIATRIWYAKYIF